jgi:hypothetical protein
VYLSYSVCWPFAVFALFSNTSQVVFASERQHEYGLENYFGYGCEIEYREDDDKNNVTKMNYAIEGSTGFGCGSTCGSGREKGYSATYLDGCRNWQQIPIIDPPHKYWIDESSLSPLTTNQQALFIASVDEAAAIWNSTRKEYAKQRA